MFDLKTTDLKFFKKAIINIIFAEVEAEVSFPLICSVGPTRDFKNFPLNILLCQFLRLMKSGNFLKTKSAPCWRDCVILVKQYVVTGVGLLNWMTFSDLQPLSLISRAEQKLD